MFALPTLAPSGRIGLPKLFFGTPASVVPLGYSATLIALLKILGSATTSASLIPT